MVNANARIGKECKIHSCVNIGASGGSKIAPHIADYVYFGLGAEIYGEITIGNRNAIAANAAVGKSFFVENNIIGGVPAKGIGDVEISKNLRIDEQN